MRSLRKDKRGFIQAWLAGFIILFIFGLGYWLVAAPIVTSLTSFSWVGMTARDRAVIALELNVFVWTGCTILFGVLFYLFAAARQRSWLDTG